MSSNDGGGSSVDKTITRHFATLTQEEFTFKKKVYRPQELVVSPLLLRGVACPPGCGGCCRRFSLDWLPSEYEMIKAGGYDMSRVVEREIEFNGRKVLILSDLQADHNSYYCRNLRAEDGRCGIHTFSPHSCDFELIRTIQTREGLPNRLTQKLFGRGWQMKRITDGKRGAMCWMEPPSKASIESVIRRLKRFQDWADHFGIKTWAPTIIDLIEKGRLTHQIHLSIPSEDEKGFGL